MEPEKKFRARNDRVLVEVEEPEEAAESEKRIIIMKVNPKEVVPCIVRKVGPKVTDVAEGDRVFLPAKILYRESQGAKHILVKECDLLGVDES